MRADRLISILLLLQVHRQVTARDLARRLEVSERTIHRDMDALSAVGIPVFAERGVRGGWSLMEPYQTNLTGLNRDEIKALFLAAPTRLLEDLGLEKASEAASIKLFATLPSTGKTAAEYARQRFYIDVAGWNRKDEFVQALPVLQNAVWSDRKIRFLYQRECEQVERMAEPLGLVAKGSVWYLVAAVDGTVRSYRVSRIREVDVLDQGFVRPPDFDLETFWKQAAQSFKENLPRYDCVLRADPDIVPRLWLAGRFARVEKAHSPDPDGWVKVEMRFQFDWEACEFVLGFGSRIEVIEPRELIVQVQEAAQDAFEFHSRKARASAR
jgi:predicted DNA-binding transcriptional regulator YafY